MNVGDFVLPLGILLWAAFEYHRREQEYKETMAYLRRGIQPPSPPDIPKAVHLWTTGGVAILLLIVVSVLLWLVLNGSIIYGSGALIILAVPFTTLSALLFLIFRRDLKRRRNANVQGN